MKPMKDYNEVEALGDFEKLEAGGYIITITDATDNEEKSYFELIYDIAAGNQKGFFSADYYADKPYMHRFWRSYNDKSKGMFKGFISALEKSNGCTLANKVIDGTLKPSDLIGKKLGVVIAYETYGTDERGRDKQRSYIASVKTVQDIKDGNYKVPDLRAAKGQKSADSGDNSAPVGFTPMTDEDLPF